MQGEYDGRERSSWKCPTNEGHVGLSRLGVSAIHLSQTRGFKLVLRQVGLDTRALSLSAPAAGIEPATAQPLRSYEASEASASVMRTDKRTGSTCAPSDAHPGTNVSTAQLRVLKLAFSAL